MKINFIAPGLFKSGGMRAIFEYCKRLAERNHDVILYHPIVPYDLNKKKINLNRFRILYWQLKSSINYKKYEDFFLNNGFKVERVFNISDYFIRDADFTIATSWPTSYSVKNLNNSKGKKLYFVQDYEFWLSNIELVDNSYKLGLEMFTTCNYLRDLFYDKFNINMEVIYYGIDFKTFYNNNLKKINKTKIITFIPHAIERKNTPGALFILKKLKEKYPDIIIKGFSSHIYQNMPNYIDFFMNPSEEELRKLYSESDLFLYTSSHEGFGLPPAEAMACKTAVAVTKVGALPEYVINNNTGIISPPDDLNDLYNKIVSYFEDDDALLKLSENGYKKVHEMFNWDASIDRFEKYIAQL